MGQLRGGSRCPGPVALLPQHRGHRGRRDRHRLRRHHARRLRLRNAAHPGTRRVLLAAAGLPHAAGGGAAHPVVHHGPGVWLLRHLLGRDPAACRASGAVSVLLARTFVHGIPDELFEAARVDGGSAISGFRHLVIPLTRPIAAAVLIFTLIGAWNNYLFPLVFLQSPEMQTITLVPQFFVGQFSNDQTKILASAVIIAIPEVIAYLSLQRMFERGLAAGAIK